MGVPHAIQVFKELKAKGQLPKKYGIRIDSGDLGYLSAKLPACSQKQASRRHLRLNDLDEYLIQSLKEQGCTVTSWGVGTKIITADGTSALGGVFKMGAREQGDGFEPVMKISNDVSKMTTRASRPSAASTEKTTAK